MSRFVTLTVQNGADIKLRFYANEANTPVKIVSGAQEYNIIVGTSWTPSSNTYNAGASTMTVYGDIIGFNCINNFDKVTGLDVSHNTTLIRLNCNSSQLTSLDVSQNTALISLECRNNQLTSLDVSQNTALTSLVCYNNQLTSLDVSQNTALTTLSCSNNQITSLDVSQNTVLEWLRCYANQLTNLDISQNTALTQLNCYANQLTSLDISQNTDLKTIYCCNNALSTDAVNNLFCDLLNREGLPSGKIYMLNNTSDANYYMVLGSNKQNALDKNWEVLYYDNSNGPLYDTDIPPTTGNYVCIYPVTGVSVNHTNATVFVGDTYQLTNQNVGWSSSNNGVATVDNNGLVTAVAAGTATITATTEDGNFKADCEITVKSLDMVSAITLTVQNGEDIGLQFKADEENTPVKIISGTQEYNFVVGTDLAPAPNNFYFCNAGASTMTVYGDISGFGCGHNYSKLTGLDISKNTALTELNCRLNELTNLDVSKNTALTKLACGYNQLTNLDVSKNTALTVLTCSGNQLTNLDVSHNTALTKFFCYNNQLTNLDLSHNTALSWLNCIENQLTSLDFSQNTALSQILCYDNPLSTEAVNALFCSLPDRTAYGGSKIFILNDTNDANHAEVLASCKGKPNLPLRGFICVILVQHPT